MLFPSAVHPVLLFLLLLIQLSPCPAFNSTFRSAHSHYKFHRLDISYDCSDDYWGRRLPELWMEHDAWLVDDGGMFRDLGDNDTLECNWNARIFIGGMGIAAVVQDMNLIDGSDKECRDYLELLYLHQFNPTKKPSNKESERKTLDSNSWIHSLTICESSQKWLILTDDGETDDVLPYPLRKRKKEEFSEEQIAELMGHPWNPVIRDRAFIYPRGEFQAVLHIGKATRRYDEPVRLYIAYTPYSECDGAAVTGDTDTDLFHCGHGLCISRKYVGDGVVNCPFADGADENSSEVAAPWNAVVISVVIIFNWSVILF